jgi:hypothetical protein
LIDRLLEAPNILDSDILIKERDDPPEIPKGYTFENDKYKSLYERIYVWHHYLNRDLRLEEAEYNMEKVHTSSSESEGEVEEDA